MADLLGQRQQQHIDGGVERTRRQLGFELAPVGAHGGDLHLRRLGGDALHQRRQQGRLEHVAHADGELRRAGGGVEARHLIEGDLEVAQRAAHRLDDAARQRRGDHGLTLPLEQRVAEHLAQARQRVADGRLGQAEYPRRFADRSPLEQMIENDKQIEIEPMKPHLTACFFV